MIQQKTTLMLAMAIIVSMMAIPATTAGPTPGCEETDKASDCLLYLVQECGSINANACIQSTFAASGYALFLGNGAYDTTACAIIKQLGGTCPTISVIPS
jgi:hypothetical protein